MYYKCRNCGYEKYRGILPGASCGMLLIVEMGICCAVLLQFAVKYIPKEPGAWKLLIYPLLAGVSFFCAILLDYLISAVEWLVYCRRKCPDCGSRRWSFGRTRGFGL
jgi:hypothetical protein